MSRAVAYYNRGTSCCIRLLTSVFSLRAYYDGRVRLYAEGAVPSEIAEVLRDLSVDIVNVPKLDEATLVVKAGLWRHLVDDDTLYLDSDTIVCGAVDELFDRLAEHGHLVTRFCDWDTSHIKIDWRIRNWTSVAPDLIGSALEYHWAINTGVQGWRRGNALLPEYERLTRLGQAAGCCAAVVDEIAMQLLVPHYPHHLADSEWNVSGQYGDVESARIIHYHGRRHCRADNERTRVWKRCYQELLARFPMFTDVLTQAWGDEALAKYQANKVAGEDVLR